VDGQRLRFAHPLIASIPYEDLAPDARRLLHQRLAKTVTDRATRPACSTRCRRSVGRSRGRTRHRGQHARARGSLDSAAELAELAV